MCIYSLLLIIIIHILKGLIYKMSEQIIETLKHQWDNILNLLEVEYDVSHMMINTWIRALSIKEVTNDTIILSMDKKLGRRGIEFIEKRMYDIYLQSAIEATLDKRFELIFIVDGEETQLDKPAYSGEYDAHIQMELERSNLNPQYTFENFVIGDSNKHAHAACVAVAEEPATTYNPLYLYGNSGLGKTHLMQAIAHHIITHNPDMKVLFVTSDTFTNDVIEAIRKNKTEELRAKYRSLDVLLIDDIQNLIGRESTQVEFFNTFNDLYNATKQIIISSDKHPKEITEFEERIRTRLGWGLPIDINPPDYETRMAILRLKAETLQINITDDILDYIATNISSDIRDLESALKTVKLYGGLEGTIEELTVEKVEEILKDTISFNSIKELTADYIIKTVSDYTNISYNDITSSKRSKEIATARQIVMYLCRKYLDLYSLKQIGDAVGGKDHTTVISGVDKIKKLIETDSNMRNTVEEIEKKINK